MIEVAPHIPVLRDEMLRALAPKDGEIYVDGTLGAGGYTRAILDAADCKVIAIDQDPQVALRIPPLSPRSHRPFLPAQNAVQARQFHPLSAPYPQSSEYCRMLSTLARQHLH